MGSEKEQLQALLKEYAVFEASERQKVFGFT